MSQAAAAPARPGHTARLHFRDGWKFPFQQNPFVKPWSFEPPSALPAWLCLSGSGLPSQLHSTTDLPLLSLRSRQSLGPGPGLPQTLLQPHHDSLWRIHLCQYPDFLGCPENLAGEGDWSLPCFQPGYHQPTASPHCPISQC
jgi:hypothetical protein